ncbi:hypothetical protein D3C76_1060970 [compost metagenome]
MFDTRRARAFVQRFEKLLGQFQMAFHPALARGVGQVQVQPEKLLVALRLLQVLQGLGGIDFPTGLTGAKTETVKQAEQIRVAMALIDAVVHEDSQGEAPVTCFTGSLERHHRKRE